MNKDVIYIDVDDDITAIIGKLKGAKEKIVALVPPKRISVLQSAVNLRLLKRAAEQANKRLVLISNDTALHALAASASIPIAKNLQSKPEVPEVAERVDDTDDDIIDGAQLPVGEHAKQMNDSVAQDSSALSAVPVIDNSVLDSLPDDTTPADAAKPVAASSAKSGKKATKVPNFGSFRKKLVLVVIAVLAVIALLVWGIFFAPRATVIVSAKTSDNPINASVTAVADGKNNVDESRIAAISAEVADDKSVEFNPTGSKNVGKKASGTVEFTNNSLSDRTVPGGTRLTSQAGLVFITDQSITVPAGSLPCGNLTCPTPGAESVSATANERGAKYNAESGSVSGEPNGVTGEFEGSTSGGTDKVVKIVTASDVQNAKQELVDEDDKSQKEAVKDEFEGDVKTIDESFAIAYENVTSVPAVGAEASNGKATLNASVVYTMLAIQTTELDSFIEAYVKDELENTSSQRVYETGVDDVAFQEVQVNDNGAALTLIATAQVGPDLKEAKIKDESRGRRFGDIQNSIQSIKGVEDVEVKFFPFWVNTVPDDLDKITVNFKVDERN